MDELCSISSQEWPLLEDAFRRGFQEAGLNVDAVRLTSSVRSRLEGLCQRLRDANSQHRFTCTFDLHLSRSQKRQLLTQIESGLAVFRQKWVHALFEILAFEIGFSEAALHHNYAVADSSRESPNMPGQNDANGYPELLEDLRSFLTEDLQSMGLVDRDCERIASAIIERIRTYWGGEQLYIPKGRLFDVSNRDQEIEAQFNGKNGRELRRRYSISERHLYRIVEQVRAKRRKKLSEQKSEIGDNNA